MSKPQYAPLAAGHVAECIAEAAGSPVSAVRIAQTYDYQLRSDLERVKTRFGFETAEDATLWIVQDTLSEMTGIDIDGDSVTLQPGKKVADLKYRGKQIDFPFNIGLEGGHRMFSPNAYSRIQEARESNVDDLVESMRVDGWRPDSTVLKDKETGAVLSGNRRLAAVQKLAQEGIEIVPQVVELDLGEGDDADADRFRHWIRSNTDRGKDLTPSQRKRIAEHLRKCGLSADVIGETLDLSPRRIRELTAEAKRQQIEQRDSEVRRLLGYGLSQRRVSELTGVSKSTVVRIGGTAETDHPTPEPDVEGISTNGANSSKGPKADPAPEPEPTPDPAPEPEPAPEPKRKPDLRITLDIFADDILAELASGAAGKTSTVSLEDLRSWLSKNKAAIIAALNTGGVEGVERNIAYEFIDAHEGAD
ncbi:hypothetical protein [Primorskyibacter sp. S87]|uniref:hypothetical protein n=1 Tax=Primorskyibacter sp. S87 TaxID=3415126 RepID=UPI003C7C2C57